MDDLKQYSDKGIDLGRLWNVLGHLWNDLGHTDMRPIL